jgi:two-component system, NtrC family, response regulator GlrR
VLMSATQRLSADDIELDRPSGAICVPSEDESFRKAKARVVEAFERQYIEQLLASHAGNVTHAARAAKKNRRAFFELMRKYKIESGEFLGGALQAQPH